MGTPDHNTGCLRRSPLTSHTTTQGFDGPTVRYKDHPTGWTRHIESQTRRTPKATEPDVPQHPHHQSGTYACLVRECIMTPRDRSTYALAAVSSGSSRAGSVVLTAEQSSTPRFVCHTRVSMLQLSKTRPTNVRSAPISIHTSKLISSTTLTIS